ncbi:hypothetical protein ABEB36_010062 [Hypothenemus hampei]|uniref:Transmembrane protein 203 n=1 Tax=Hypothenemus hampei TaxID=57062 RepID=A0ABD1EID4_HYPHA
MFFSVRDVSKWLGLHLFVMCIMLVSVLVFTIILVIKFDPNIETPANDWWVIFSPLFVGDALCAYFCVIIFLRIILEITIKRSILKLCWSVTFLTLIFVFKFLLCKKLLAQLSLDYSEVFAPLYILLQLIAFRACQQT